MFYTEKNRIGTLGTEYRFLVTNKKKWKNFTTKNRV
jgi:hypothetical protein